MTDKHPLTDAQKIKALTDLFICVTFSLENTKYEICDRSEAANVIFEAEKYRQQMFNILHGEN